MADAKPWNCPPTDRLCRAEALREAGSGFGFGGVRLARTQVRGQVPGCEYAATVLIADGMKFGQRFLRPSLLRV